MSLTQSGDDLSRLLRALDEATNGALAKRVTRSLAVTGRSLVHEGFAASKAPSGQRWKPLAARRGKPQTRKPLRKTGALEGAALVFTVDAGGFVFSAVDRIVGYGHFHQSQEPRTRLPRRPFYPDDNGGSLPVGWAIQMRWAADEAVREWMPK